ncbi:TIR domain-containing protein [Pectobacterium polaris]|uniref:TIR domain-containing protein n=1 Tax=Pectobacterium polaris TaxID=2042057 RepID=UPI001CC78E13|nr:TIR domain-containing protein [Pectobacterium polaris]UAY92877.1 TIR domain-containing protein [Pectobacterium polaris]
MARETFISYKYSEAQKLRDDILKSLGDDATYYKGETTESPDISSTTVDNIKNNLKDMIFGTSVTIVVISPNMKSSKWIDWEIEYSLKEYKRGTTTSRTNGIVGVIMKVNGGYDWLISSQTNPDGCSSRIIESNKLYDIINNNRYNFNTEDRHSCEECKSYDKLTGSYISLIEEHLFLETPSDYIENAYDKSKSLIKYDLSKRK